MRTVVVRSKTDPPCLVQVLWFVFVGWWSGQIWVAIAWLLMLTIVGIPFGIMMMNRVPQVVALRKQDSGLTVTQVGEVTVISDGGRVPQQNILIRVIYFLLIGWWLSGIWMETAYLLCLTIIGIPIGFRMFDKVPAIVSLHR